MSIHLEGESMEEKREWSDESIRVRKEREKRRIVVDGQGRLR